MKCIKHKPTGSGGCQRGAVSQASCRRKATQCRVTSKGCVIRLCSECDAEIGRIVGLPVFDSILHIMDKGIKEGAT